MSSQSALAWMRPVAGVATAAVTTDPVVSLSFDDGPDPDVTPAVLDVLARRGARATFFVLGQQAERYPDLTRRIAREGHEVALHGDVHQRLNRVGLGQTVQVVRGGRRRLERVLGARVHLFRPPGGAQTPASYLLARLLGLRVVMWSVEVKDWIDRDLEDMVSDGLERLRPGGIVLLHDGLSTGRRVSFDRAVLADRLLDGVAQRGWTCVPCGQLLDRYPSRREVWFKRRIRGTQPPTTGDGVP